MHGHLILTAAQMQAADRATIEQGISGFLLMERAGEALAHAASQMIQTQRKLEVVAGPGNNGGDGFAAARIWQQHGGQARIFLFVEPEALHGDAASHLDLATKAGVEVVMIRSEADLTHAGAVLNQAPLVLDAMFGTGLKRPVQGLAARVVEAVNASPALVLAADIASGIDSDTGSVLGTAVQADITLPIAACKWGHWLAAGAKHAGKVLTPAVIGIAGEVMRQAMLEEPGPVVMAKVMDHELLREALPHAASEAHKKQLGHVWVMGGAVGYSGAPQLAAMGAQAVGTGLVSIACPDDIWAVVAAGSADLMVHPESNADYRQADAVVAGPGWGQGRSSLLRRLLDSDIPLVLDADALNVLASDGGIQKLLTDRRATCVLTPHPGEAARLLRSTTADVQQDRLQALSTLVERFVCPVILKGKTTLMMDVQGQVYACPFGSNRLARAGTGDVLAGMLGGYMAQGLPAGQAMLLAVGLHALAGEHPAWYRAMQLPDVVYAIKEKLLSGQVL